MEKLDNILQSEQPEALADNSVAVAEDTKPYIPPTNSENDRGIVIKFNKENRTVSYDEAVSLAQKGLKFDKISGDFTRLKALAEKSGKSITQYISDIENGEIAKHREALLQKCGGNEELTEHILSLEESAGGKIDDGFEQLQAEFPEIKSVKDLPNEVLEAVELLGGNLLSAYLLFKHRQERLGEEYKIKEQQSKEASVGSQQQYAVSINAVNEEFIKGIWN